VEAEDGQAEDLEQHLRADHRGVGGGVVLRGDLDDVAADDVEALGAVQNGLGLAWVRPPASGVPVPGAESSSLRLFGALRSWGG
jgi:hypothetical protein